MTTPTRTEIETCARELWHRDRARSGDPSFDIEPELNELKEGGYLSAAQSEVMRDKSKAETVEWKGYTENLENSSDLKLDVQEALASGIYTCGTRNVGKSDLNMMIADTMRSNDVIVLVFDPSQDWLKRSSIQKYLTIQPSTPIAIPNESTIYDLSLLTLPEQKSYVERFNHMLFEHQINNSSRWYFCIFEEAHQYFPQGCLRAKMFQYSVRLLTQGRNFKISMALITQFSSMLDKDTLKFMQQRFFGASNETNDLKYLKGFLNERAKELIALDSGQFLCFNKGKILKMNIKPYQSENVKTEIQLSLPERTEPIRPIQNISIIPLAKLFMLLAFAVLVLSSLRGM